MDTVDLKATVDLLSLGDKITMALLYPGKNVRLPDGSEVILNRSNLEVIRELHLSKFSELANMDVFRATMMKDYPELIDSAAEKCSIMKEREKVPANIFCGLQFEGCMAGRLYYSDGLSEGRCITFREYRKVSK